MTLIEQALRARKFAYAPYSNFQVGAALECKDGSVFTACNVENASFGLTSCAERNAVFAAIANGKRQFTRLALALPGGASPCGACRQVLNEFAPDLIIEIAAPDSPEQVTHTTLKELLPQAFGPNNLGTR